MNQVKITKNNCGSLAKLLKSLASDNSSVYLNENKLVVITTSPIPNIFQFDITNSTDQPDVIKLNFKDLMNILKINDDIEINKTKDLVTFKIKKSVIKTSDFTIEQTKDYFEFKEEDEIDFWGISSIKVHEKNLSNSTSLNHLNGIFIIEDKSYSTDSYSAIRTDLTSGKRDGMTYIPSDLFPLIYELAKSKIKLFISDEWFVINGGNFKCKIRKDNVIISDKMIKLFSALFSDSFEFNKSFTISGKDFEELVDIKTLKSLGLKELKFVVSKDKIKVTSTNLISYETSISNNNKESVEFTIDLDEILKVYDTCTLCSTITLGICEDKSLIKIEFDKNTFITKVKFEE